MSTNNTPVSAKSGFLTVLKYIVTVAGTMSFFSATHAALVMLLTGQFIGQTTGHTGGEGWLFVSTWVPLFIVQTFVYSFIFGIATFMGLFLWAFLGKQAKSGETSTPDSTTETGPAAHPFRTVGKWILIADLTLTSILVTSSMITEVVFGHFANASTGQLVALFISGWLAAFPMFALVLGGIMSIATTIILVLVALFSKKSAKSAS